MYRCINCTVAKGLSFEDLLFTCCEGLVDHKLVKKTTPLYKMVLHPLFLAASVTSKALYYFHVICECDHLAL